jgi:hypothetical protein
MPKGVDCLAWSLESELMMPSTRGALGYFEIYLLFLHSRGLLDMTICIACVWCDQQDLWYSLHQLNYCIMVEVHTSLGYVTPEVL